MKKAIKKVNKESSLDSKNFESINIVVECMESDGGLVLKTYFTYPDDSSIQIHVSETKDGIELSDNGETFEYLFNQNYDTDTEEFEEAIGTATIEHLVEYDQDTKVLTKVIQKEEIHGDTDCNIMLPFEICGFIQCILQFVNNKYEEEFFGLADDEEL